MRLPGAIGVVLALASTAWAVLPAIDDFNRGSLGSNWTQNTAFNGTDTCVILGSSALSGAGVTGDEVNCFWNQDTATTEQYACGLISGVGSNNQVDEAGVCVRDSVTGGAVCCVGSSDGIPANAYWCMYGLGDNSMCTGSGAPFVCCTGAGTGTCNGTFVLTSCCTSDCTTNTFQAGEYIGIQRASDGVTYECFRSPDGMAWQALGSATSFTAGGTAPSMLGAWGSVGNPNTLELDAWEGGNGLLPTSRACASAIVTTTTTTGTGTTSTSTTTTSTTTTTTTATATSTTASSSSTTTTTTTTSSTTTTVPTTTSTVTTTTTTATTSTTTTSTSTTSTTSTTLLCGDVNGDGVVDIGDAFTIQQFVAGIIPCSKIPHPDRCDVNHDGFCNAFDAQLIAECDVGQIPCLFTCGPFQCPTMTPHSKCCCP